MKVPNGYINTENVDYLIMNPNFRSMWSEPNYYGEEAIHNYFKNNPKLDKLSMTEVKWAMNHLTSQMRDLFLRIEYK